MTADARTLGFGDRVADQDIHGQMVAEIPRLRRFARNLVGSADRADDLVQEALANAVAGIEGYRPGTSLRAWLFTILRNVFLSERRRDARSPFVETPEDQEPPEQPVPAGQESRLAIEQIGEAVMRLPEHLRQALLLVAVEGLEYEEAAAVMAVPIGTVRSRVARAREALRLAIE